MQQLLNSAEVAKRLGCSIETVCRRARLGDIPIVHKAPGRTGAWLFDGQVIELLARKSPGSSSPEPGHDAHKLSKGDARHVNGNT